VGADQERCAHGSCALRAHASGPAGRRVGVAWFTRWR
jgi:hypothetical protein